MKYLRAFLALALLMLGILAVPIRAAAAAALPSGAKVLALGDSITGGVGSTHGLAYRQRLGERLTASGATYTIATSAENGMTSTTMLTWIRGVVAAERPDVIVLAIGTNDAVGTTEQRAAFQSRYAALLWQIYLGWKYAKVIVCRIGLAVAPNEWMRPFQQDVNSQIDRAFTSYVAPRTFGPRPGLWMPKLTLLGPADFTVVPASGMSADGFHPNDSGYDIMGDVVYSVMAQHYGLAL